MGAKIFAVITVAAITSFIWFNTVKLNEKIDDIICEVKDAEGYDAVLRTKEKYEKYERFISISVSHNDLMNIEDLFAQYEQESLEDSEQRYVTKNRLISALCHLRRLSAINIDSII